MTGGPPTDDSIPSLVAQLVDEGKQYARAEVAVYRARLTPRIAEARNAAIFAVAALSLVQALLVAGLVGLILALSRWLGPGGATAAVVGVGLLIVGLLGWLAFLAVGKAFGATKEPKA